MKDRIIAEQELVPENRVEEFKEYCDTVNYDINKITVISKALRLGIDEQDMEFLKSLNCEEGMKEFLCHYLWEHVGEEKIQLQIHTASMQKLATINVVG